MMPYADADPVGDLTTARKQHSAASPAGRSQNSRPVRTGLLLILALSLGATAVPAIASEPQTSAPEEDAYVTEYDGDFVSQTRLDDSGFGLATVAPITDPYGDDPWVAYLPLRTAPAGTHYWEVWSCNESGGGPPTLSPAEFIATFGSAATNWYVQVSGGSYSPQFVAMGSYSADSCLSQAPSVAEGRGLIALRGGCCGLGGPGPLLIGQSTIELVGARRAEVGTGGIAPGGDLEDAPWILDTLVHEMGHGLGWPHVPAVGTGAPSDYNNIADVMSGGTVVAGVPAPTAAFNQYASGWISPTELTTWEEGTTSIRLGTPKSSRSPILMIPAEEQGRFHTISVTPTSVESSSPRGVLVHHVDQTWSPSGGYCIAEWACILGSHTTEALVAPGTEEGSSGQIDPVLDVGETIDVASWTVRVTAEHPDGFTVELSGASSGPTPSAPADDGPFADVPADHTFANAIERLADAGITQGCNPPANTHFCPDNNVTRGQMAAFIGRALNLTTYTGPDRFTDDNGHTFETAIERLAQAGITQGCNPPANTHFCPDNNVTRGQMAAFIGRALNLTTYTGPDRFTDDNGHTFETAIERLAQAGITQGCNPPANTHFCPDNNVTRGQMAAFIVRAGLAN